MDLGSLLGNVATGGILGAVGGIAQAGLQMWQAKQAADHEKEMKSLDQAHEKDRWAHDLETAKFESEAKTKLAEIDATTQTFVADANLMAGSFTTLDKRTFSTDASAEKFPTLFALVDFTRGIIRPWITLYMDFILTLLCAWVTYETIKHFPGVLTDGTLKDVFKALVEAIIFMSTTATMWWFAARGMKVSIK